jgi:hypothetical protein
VPPHLSLGFTNAVPGRDDEFNAWYDTYHLSELVRNVDGYARGRRYRLADVQRTGQGAGRPAPWRYLALYEVEGDDMRAVHEELVRFREGGGFTPHDGLLAPGTAAWLYAPVGEGVTKAGLASKTEPLGASEHVFLAFTNATAGREADLERWYATHLAEVVQFFPGLVTGMRYKLSPHQRPEQSPDWRYLAFYDLEAHDLAEYHRRDAEVRLGGGLTPHEGALDLDYGVWIYTPLGPWADGA